MLLRYMISRKLCLLLCPMSKNLVCMVIVAHWGDNVCTQFRRLHLMFPRSTLIVGLIPCLKMIFGALHFGQNWCCLCILKILFEFLDDVLLVVARNM
jgi:hypothetical protein